MKMLGGLGINAAQCALSRKLFCLSSVRKEKKSKLCIDLAFFNMDQDAKPVTENLGTRGW